MPDLLHALRAGTRALHDQLDGAALSGRITDGTLSATDYVSLVTWQYAAHAAAEEGLEGFPWPGAYRYRGRRAVLSSEAEALGLQLPRVRTLAPPRSLTEATGRAYVLEGSSLGGNMLLGHLRSNERLASLGDFGFYAFQRDVGLRQWRAFVTFAKAQAWTAQEVDAAVADAREVFGVFGRWMGGHPPA